jgi:hypothetical protein
VVGEARHRRHPVALWLRCPVPVASLNYVLAADERFGVWGGMAPGERPRWASLIGSVAASPCSRSCGSAELTGRQAFTEPRRSPRRRGSVLSVAPPTLAPCLTTSAGSTRRASSWLSATASGGPVAVGVDPLAAGLACGGAVLHRARSDVHADREPGPSSPTLGRWAGYVMSPAGTRRSWMLTTESSGNYTSPGSTAV